ncbi:hypothetical protein LSH36_98g02018 [Paralvinella palmiformis]|uniref:Nicotinamide-nucleotide adenylyltransferase n=1 Tax=Paralvinella palmiformis TaxID=53620 RepID=A0AAD9K071_9ANNE|nr:hypothetical protein LSH36_98g02018 [Paralvinella palmiformis]
MCSPTRIILLACGSFNPITNMHLRMFELARDALHRSGRYQVIGGIISPVSDAYNKKDLASAKHRCAMIRLSLKSSDWIRLEPWESEQEVWSTTLKVLRHHKEQRQDTSTQIRLLCGADLLESFGIPGLWKDKDIEEILNKYGLVCISRSGSNPEKFIYEHDILSKYQVAPVSQEMVCWAANIQPRVQIQVTPMSARRALRRGESVKYLVHDPVIDYVKTHNLYGAGENEDFCRMYEPATCKQAPQCEYSPTWDTPPSDPSPKRKSPLKFFQRFNWIINRILKLTVLSWDYQCYPRSISPVPFHGQLLTNQRLSPTRVYYRTVHDSYVSRSVDSDTSSRSHGHRSYRRYRELNLDEEHRRRDYRRDSSLDSLDSDHSFPRSPHSPRRGVTCIGADLSGLVRRVRGMRVTMTPETCV